jgi:hypothetical protein
VYRDRLLGAGVGLPGPIHRATGMPAPSMILPGWAAVHVADELGRGLGIPSLSSDSVGYRRNIRPDVALSIRLR